jgi:deazaflavin-dependent oxidoreductase (nitroreductase family)
VSATQGPATGLTFKERIGLFLHRELDRRLSPLGVLVMRRTRGSLAARFKVHALVLRTVGRRTGRARDVVLQYFPDGEGFVLVATNDGGASHPAWYLNLTAAGTAQVEVDGRRVPVSATELTGDEAAAWWDRILDRAPDYERYARAARRTFPIVRLAPGTAPSTRSPT